MQRGVRSPPRPLLAASCRCRVVAVSRRRGVAVCRCTCARVWCGRLGCVMLSTSSSLLSRYFLAGFPGWGPFGAPPKPVQPVLDRRAHIRHRRAPLLAPPRGHHSAAAAVAADSTLPTLRRCVTRALWAPSTVKVPGAAHTLGAAAGSVRFCLDELGEVEARSWIPIYGRADACTQYRLSSVIKLGSWTHVSSVVTSQHVINCGCSTSSTRRPPRPRGRSWGRRATRRSLDATAPCRGGRCLGEGEGEGQRQRRRQRQRVGGARARARARARVRCVPPSWSTRS